MKKEYGKHYLVELMDCDPAKLKTVKEVRQILLKAAEKSKATVVKHFFHQYKPYGVTGIILISESHFSVHTWPQDKYAAFDILTCGKMFPQRAVKELEKGFRAKRVKVKVVRRGF